MTPAPQSPLYVLGSGMVTAVGLDAPSSCAALRARLDGFQETRFPGRDGTWIIGAPVPMPRNWMGTRRLAHMCAAAICEVFDQVPEAEGRTRLILCLAEDGRAGRLITDSDRFLRMIGEIVALPEMPRVHIVAHGRPSGFVALQTARRLLAEGADYVMILGVDSYLTAPAIGQYHGQARLLTPTTPDGFIPGEAAAAVLCAARHRGGLAISGLGLAREPAPIYNGRDTEGFDLPLRGDGMTRAYSAAFAEAALSHSDIVLKIGDHSGESFWFRQTALAMMRTQRARSEVQPIWAVGASLGNVGAAVVPLMLGWALAAAEKRYGPQGPVLIEASGDDGACGALVAGAAA